MYNYIATDVARNQMEHSVESDVQRIYKALICFSVLRGKNEERNTRLFSY